MSITKYQFITAFSNADLVTAVNAAIAAGSQPYGDPVYDANRNAYAQAVTDGTAPSGSGGVTSVAGTDPIKIDASDAANPVVSLDATDIGKSLLAAADATAARKVIGAGDGTVTSANITDATVVGKSLITATDAAAALSDIGALAATGTAASATKLATARKLTYTGGATGDATFDGTADVSIALTLAAATATAAGAVKLGAAVADAEDSVDAPTQLNALLASLRSAGIIASS